jgi:hypothetical protein
MSDVITIHRRRSLQERLIICADGISFVKEVSTDKFLPEVFEYVFLGWPGHGGWHKAKCEPIKRSRLENTWGRVNSGCWGENTGRCGIICYYSE